MLFDIRSYKVPNVLILTGYAVGTINLCARHGVTGILISIISIAIVWLIFFPVYTIRGLGGGDCKLLAWIPLFIKAEWILEGYFYIFVCAGVVGVIKLVFRKSKRFRFTIAAFLGVLWCVLKHL